MPFGIYRLCVVDLAAKKYAINPTDYDNTSPNGNTTGMDVAISTTGTTWKTYSGTPTAATCGFSS